MRLLAIVLVVCGCTALHPLEDAAVGGDAMALDGDATDTSSDVDAPGAPCALVGASCPGDEACYPFPFESASPTQTRCAFPGAGTDSVPCQSQLDCDGTSICSDPGDPASVCLLRCDVGLPFCPLGTTCHPLGNYPGIGACTL